jgi:UDP-GlcNAc:undecaprenyl-phosphate GlcNAc-1-phosphate transferase
VSPAVLLPVTGVLSAVVTLGVIIRGSRFRPPMAINYRGERLLVVLGIAITAGVVTGTLGALVADLRIGEVLPTIRGTLQLLAAVLMVFVAGVFDDAQAGPGVRGLLGHARALARGSLTSGAIKVVALLAAAIIAVEATLGLSLDTVVGIPLIAGSANLWNLLDVAPGRATKYFIPAGAVMVALAPTSGASVFLATALAGAIVALPFDLKEQAMLGDAGANVLGFVVGLGLFIRLSATGSWIALAAVVILHVLAETITLSRVIGSVPPLRWFDRLGRVAHAFGHVQEGRRQGVAG